MLFKKSEQPKSFRNSTERDSHRHTSGHVSGAVERGSFRRITSSRNSSRRSTMTKTATGPCNQVFEMEDRHDVSICDLMLSPSDEAIFAHEIATTKPWHLHSNSTASKHHQHRFNQGDSSAEASQQSPIAAGLDHLSETLAMSSSSLSRAQDPPSSAMECNSPANVSAPDAIPVETTSTAPISHPCSPTVSKPTNPRPRTRVSVPCALMEVSASFCVRQRYGGFAVFALHRSNYRYRA